MVDGYWTNMSSSVSKIADLCLGRTKIPEQKVLAVHHLLPTSGFVCQPHVSSLLNSWGPFTDIWINVLELRCSFLLVTENNAIKRSCQLGERAYSLSSRQLATNHKINVNTAIFHLFNTRLWQLNILWFLDMAAKLAQLRMIGIILSFSYFFFHFSLSFFILFALVQDQQTSGNIWRRGVCTASWTNKL